MLVGEGIPQIPTHRQQNHFPWILTTFERIPGGDRHALRYQIRSRRKFATKPCADFSGKGVSAALMMAHLQALAHGRLLAGEEIKVRSLPDTFVTALNR